MLYTFPVRRNSYRRQIGRYGLLDVERRIAWQAAYRTICSLLS
jgi:hypothetical protein